MRRIFFATTTFVLLFAQICYAATTLNRSDADSRARQSFSLRSVEGEMYDLRIVGDGETVLTDWLWALDDTIFAGDYSAYLCDANSDTFTRQDVELFANNFGGEHPQRINVTRDNRDGCHKVTGVNGLPDLLVSKIQITGGGFFDMKIFVVKNGRLQTLQFPGDGSFKTSRDTGFEPTTYRDDGTISVPWWTNAPGSEGRYVTFYRLDADNLTLSPLRTEKTWSPQ